jgi:3-hydroxyisobutyrate dehydrogenase-like beta-hydroxyacid dehydrogenase
MRLAFIGAGRMGRPMVHRLIAAGHTVRVLAHSEPARRELAEDGVDVVDDIGAVADQADAIIICVLSDDQVRDVCLDPALPTGSTVIVHTTASPVTMRAIAGKGMDVLDAPVSGGPRDVAAGRITLFVGGLESLLNRARPVLASYGDPIIHMGQLGSGQRAKLVNNVVFAAQIGLLAHAVRLADQWGVDESALLHALTHGSAASRALTGAAARGSVAAFARATGPFLDKDIRTFRAAAEELGGDLGVLDDALHALADAV